MSAWEMALAKVATECMGDEEELDADWPSGFQCWVWVLIPTT